MVGALPTTFFDRRVTELSDVLASGLGGAAGAAGDRTVELQSACAAVRRFVLPWLLWRFLTSRRLASEIKTDLWR